MSTFKTSLKIHPQYNQHYYVDNLSKLTKSLGLLSLGALACIFTPANIAYSEPNTSLVKLYERSDVSPASMCLTLSKRNVVAQDANNFEKLIELRELELGTLPQDINSKSQEFKLTQEQINSGKIIKADPYINDDMLCFTNLKHGSDYAVTLKSNLLFTNGTKLNEDLNIAFNTSDATPQIKLPQNIILPKNSHNTEFVIRTINQPSFRLQIYKLNAQNLSPYQDIAELNNDLNNYSLVSLLNKSAHKVYERIFNINDNSVKKIELDFLGNTIEPNTTYDYVGLEAKKRNQIQDITIELKDFVNKYDDGIYLILATDPRIDTSNYNNLYSYQNGSLPQSANLLVITDLGVSSYKTDKQILVNVRSLTNAKVKEGVKVDLIARNKEILHSLTTDKNGSVVFTSEYIKGTGPLEPSLIVASTKDDIYTQNLLGTPLYLEDNQGQKQISNYNVYAYTDRGIYRSGESVHYNALVRDDKLQAVNLPLTLILKNSFNSEIIKTLLDKSYAGGYEYSFDLPKGLRQGSYSLELKLGNKLLNSTKFTVGSYVPNQITSVITSANTLIDPNTPFALQSKSTFNYGSAASNLKGKFTIIMEADSYPFISHNKSNASLLKELRKFHFGIEKREISSSIKREETELLQSDVEGLIKTNINLKASDYPQKATIISTIYDTNAQEVNVAKNYKIAYHKPLIGVKALVNTNNANAFASNEDVAFALCSYLQDGSTYPQEVKYHIYKEFNDYNYVYENGTWKVLRFNSRSLVAQGKANIDNQDLNKALITANLNDGNYVIELSSDKSKTSYAFVKGYLSSNTPTSPDRIALYTDKAIYQVGDKLRLSFDSPFDGSANLIIGNQDINSFTVHKVKQGHNEITVDIKDNIYPQGHALLTIFSPLDDSPKALRAIGLSTINLNLDSHKLKLSTQVDKEIKPLSTLQVKLQAQGLDENTPLSSQAYAKVSLVDNGILALTKYKAPDPNLSLMQNYAYNIDIFDPYNLIISDPKQSGQGYDSSDEMALKSNSLSTLSALPFKTVALASKIVPLDEQGRAQVNFDIPQFAGSLKVMSVAWTNNQTGANSEEVIVRDNAVASLGLPRFLNLGDNLIARLNLNNIKAKDNNFKFDITCSGSIKCSTQGVKNLKPGIREDEYFNIQATSQGIGYINLNVLNQDFNLNESYKLTVTSPRLPNLNSYTYYLEPQQKASVDLNNFNAIEGISIAKSLLPNVNVQALSAQINPFNSSDLKDLICELDSKLMYGKLLIAPAGHDNNHNSTQDINNLRENYTNLSNSEHTNYQYQSESELNSDIQDLILRIMGRLDNYGNFRGSDAFTNVYACEVLLRAKSAQFNLNQNALDKLISRLRAYSSDVDNASGAYAAALLSQFESINNAQLRHTYHSNIASSPLTLAYQAQSLYNIGDYSYAQNALDKSINALLNWQKLNDELANVDLNDKVKRDNLLSEISKLNDNFTIDLRQVAFVVIESALRLKENDKVNALINKLHILKDTPHYLNTMTMSFMLKTNYYLDNKAIVSNNLKYIKADEIKDNKLELVNDTNSPLFMTASILGDQKRDNIINNQGINVFVNYFNEQEQIDLNQYKFGLNETVLMEVMVERKIESSSNSLIKVKLPAGFEFVSIPNQDDPKFGRLIANVPTKSPQSYEISDDMILCTYPHYSNNKFSFFVVLRAATPGVYEQGEALMQLENSPEIFGSYKGDAKININQY